ncbi:calcium-binding protein [Falsihalocynthiibacter sp. S25ZX9]|uniref:calcium-binding protein n=1 Tax=Falsihalocynthiibacter sp. S25ZX9 TaxID=3240870 RepID=UPI00350F5D5B
MAYFSYKTTLLGGHESYWSGISDMAVQWNDGVASLYAASQVGNGVTSYQLGSGSDALFRSQTAYSQIEVPGVATALETFTMEGGTYVISSGLQADNLLSFTYASSGVFSKLETFASDVPFEANLRDVTCVMVAESMFLFSAHSGIAGISIYGIDSDRVMTQRGPEALSSGQTGEDVAGMKTLTNASATYLLVGSASLDNVTSYRIGGDGTLTSVGSMGTEQGLGISDISAISTVSNNSGDYVLVAARGSSSISVLRMYGSGTLVPVDHVIDDLSTRFQNVTTMETIVSNGRTYVLVGGADDGLSLFTLLPDGRLHHLTSMADTVQMALENISAVTMSDQNGELQIFAASGVEAGITQLTATIGEVGETRTGTGGNDTITGSASDDILFGANGDDEISGGAGDDILMDGSGVDQLRGGAGHDTFILSEDGQRDTILDFDATLDILDLSGFTLFRSIEQLTVTTTSSGALLTFGEEVISLMSANGQPIYHSTLAGMTIVNATHTPVSWILPEGARNGSADNDVMEGSSAVDILYGLGGADFLRGYGGNDTLDGGDGDDILVGLAGADYLLGGRGDDTVAYVYDAASGGTSGVLVNLHVGVAWDGFGNKDTIEEVENVSGTNQADTITGNNDGNRLFGLDGNDKIYGLDGDDLIAGGVGADYLRGGLGNDMIYGGTWGDQLFGEAGNDLLNGYWGNDYLDGGTGYDTLFGGDGDDVLSGGYHRDKLYGDAGNDRLYGGVGNDDVLGGSGNDRLYGGQGNDLLGGGLGNDTLVGEDGNDRLYGSHGNDYLQGGDGYDFLYGGDGDDALSGGSLRDIMNGDAGNDRLYGGLGNDDLLGGTGNDQLYGGQGNDLLGGGIGADTLRGEDGNDRLYGSHGNDYLQGGDGYDFLYGGNGDDALSGGSDRDILNGDAGNDRLYGGLGNDDLLGGAGNDLVLGGYGSDLIGGGAGNDTLYGEAGNDRIYGGDGVDRLFGNDGDDFLFGGGSRADGGDVIDGGSGHDYVNGGYGNDVIMGRDGNDTLNGSVGSDTLYGGVGNDLLVGGIGNDRLHGGMGADRFYHNSYWGNGTDTVMDYDGREGDRLLFSHAASENDFRVVLQHSSETNGQRMGSDNIREAHIVYIPTGQTAWILIDGAALDQININSAGATFDLMN